MVLVIKTSRHRWLDRCSDLNGCVKVLIEHLGAWGWTHWSHPLFSLGPDKEYWCSHYGSSIWDFAWTRSFSPLSKIKVAGASGRLAFSAPDAPRFIDANTVMTKPTNVRSPWLMAFPTDWFVCDGIHGGQNVSLHQSIRASGVTAHFHYEEEVNLTFHLQCVMRVIRKRGPEIKETLRNCPRRAAALPGNQTQKKR